MSSYIPTLSSSISDDLYKFVEYMFQDPKTGAWRAPIYTFPIATLTPYEPEPLHNDPIYQNRVIDSIHLSLTEKWLHSYPLFNKIFKYFKVERSGTKGTVSLIDNPDKPNENIKEEDKKFIFMFVEKHYLTRKFVKRVLREYVITSHVKWYDLFNNKDTLKELFAHKLKKAIVVSIYVTNDKK